MTAIEAVYENGVFRPLQPVPLPEGARVEVFASVSARSRPAPHARRDRRTTRRRRPDCVA